MASYNHRPLLFLFQSMMVVILLANHCGNCLSWPSTSERHVEAMFVFGDSIIDNGNNFYIPQEIGYDSFISLPYGIDFPCGPSGRFTNDRNPGDILGQLLGIPYFLPTVLDPRTHGIRTLYGVNYASGGSGILDSTGSRGIPFIQQVDYLLNKTLPDLRSQYANDSAKLEFFLDRSLFVFNTGGTDLGACFSANKTDCTSSQFSQGILDTFIEQIERIYQAGAKKFVLFGIQAIGCNPGTRYVYAKGENECAVLHNEAALTFNDLLLSSMRQDFNTKFPGSVFMYVNTYNIIMDIVNDPQSYGFKVSNSSCCDLGKTYFCKRQGGACADRRAYVYWDGFHFTDAAYNILARKAFSSKLETEVYPFNVEHLARLSLRSKSDL